MGAAPSPKGFTRSKNEVLLEGARHGDRQALESLLAAEQTRIYGFASKMCRDPHDAEDIVQDTMLAISRTIAQFRGEASLSTWLFQIARSFCLKKRRRRKGQPAVYDTLEAAPRAALRDDAPNPEVVTSRHEGEETLRLALLTLPAGAREVLILRDIEGLSAPEVAQIVGTSIEAVKSKLHRARLALAKALKPRGGLGLCFVAGAALGFSNMGHDLSDMRSTPSPGCFTTFFAGNDSTHVQHLVQVRAKSLKKDSHAG